MRVCTPARPNRIHSAIVATCCMVAMPGASAADVLFAPLQRNVSGQPPQLRASATGHARHAPQMASTQTSKGAPSVQFSSDFGTSCSTPTEPVGFGVHDIDLHTPHPSIVPQSPTWTVFNDYRHNGDCVAMSVSFFQPGGVANDWLVIDTLLTPDAGTLLRWNAVAYFSGFPDGYQVRYSTTTAAPASFLAHPPLLTVTAENPVWTSHELSLAAFAGTPIHIAFRNASDDKYLLALDDVYVGPRPAVDPAIEGVEDTGSDYSVVPAFLQVPFELHAKLRNAGTSTLATVGAQAQTFAAGEPADTFASTPVASLAPADMATVLLGAGTFDVMGDWVVETHANAAGTDGDPGNATRADRLMTVSTSELRYADRRGEGHITEIHHYRYGQDFLLPRPAQLAGVTLTLVDNGSNDPILYPYAELYRWDEATRQLGDMVNVLYAEPEVESGIMYVTLVPAWTPTLLPAGHYMLLTVQEEDFRLVLRGSRTLAETNWKVDVVESELSVSPIEETYPTAAGLTWDFTLELAPLTPFADGFE